MVTLMAVRRFLSGENEENNKNLPGYPVTRPIFQLGTCRIMYQLILRMEGIGYVRMFTLNLIHRQ
jgi:hypothetical protein